MKCEEEIQLATDQEEADTKVFLCTKHASLEFSTTSICILIVDSDIGIYVLYFQNQFPNIRMYIQTGTGIRRRILDIKSMSQELEVDCCRALPALHAFTGNDYTSAFHSVGKVKAFKAIMKDDCFISAFKSIGDSFTFDSSTFPKMEEFVCALYSVKCKTVNEARYTKFCANSRATEPQKLPPTRDALLCHCKRVAYVISIVKRSLENGPRIPSPDGYGEYLHEGNLEIQWMLLPPAPEQILNLISCGCKKSSCIIKVCVCKMHG